MSSDILRVIIAIAVTIVSFALSWVLITLQQTLKEIQESAKRVNDISQKLEDGIVKPFYAIGQVVKFVSKLSPKNKKKEGKK